MMHRRHVLGLGAGAALGLAAPAWGQAYPTRPVRIVVSFAPGGNADVTTRILAARMSESLGKPFVVDNKPGAAGNIGVAEVAKAAPDGHTLLMVPSITAVNGVFTPNLPFDFRRDFVPVGMMATTPLALVVPASLPVKTIADLVAYARTKPEGLNYGSGGMGSGSHLTAELLLQKTGMKATHVPYRGGAAALTDIMGGTIQLFFDALVTAAAAAKGNQIRVLAITTAQRSDLLPDVPTFAELGLPEFSDVYIWTGISAPTGTSPEIIALLNAEMNKALNDPEVRAKLKALGATPAPGTPAEFGRVVNSEVDRWSGVIQAAKIKFE